MCFFHEWLLRFPMVFNQTIFLNLLLGLVLLLGFGGCGPTHKTYFKPEAAGGITFKETCGGHTGASNGIVFDESMVKIWFVAAIHKPILFVEIFFKEPGQITLTPNNFVLRNNNGESHSLSLEKLQVIENVKEPKSQKRDLTILDNSHLPGDKNTVYYLWFPLPSETKQEFFLDISPFSTNKGTISLPPIHWTQVEESFYLERIFIWNC